MSPPPAASTPLDPGASAPAGPGEGVGSAGWFESEVHVHDAYLRKFLRRSFPTIRDVDDVVQESYLRMWKARGGAQIEKAQAFLFQVARRLAIDVLRRRKISKVDAVEDLSQLAVIDERVDVAEGAARLDEFLLLARAFESLPPRCREVMLLRKIEGVPQKEIGRRLGIGQGTVQAHVLTGVMKLRQYMAEHGAKR